MQKKYTITLNRAHKIAERLGTKQGELRSLIIESSALVSMSGYSDQQIDRLTLISAQVIEKIAEQAKIANAQAVIRGAIGRANADHGVNEILAQIDANKKIIQTLSGFCSIQGESGNAVKLSEVKDYKQLTQSESLLRGSSLTISIFDDVEIQSIRMQKESLEKTNFSLNDKLADLNGKLVSFEMDEAIAELMGFSQML